MRKGARYIHPRFMDPSDNSPLVVEVTAIRGHRVYFRPVYQPGPSEHYGCRWWAPLEWARQWVEVKP